jgi:hypothetical protein
MAGKIAPTTGVAEPPTIKPLVKPAAPNPAISKNPGQTLENHNLKLFINANYLAISWTRRQGLYASVTHRVRQLAFRAGCAVVVKIPASASIFVFVGFPSLECRPPFACCEISSSHLLGLPGMKRRDLATSAFRFVLIIGVANLFADMTYEGARGVTGPFLGSLGARADEPVLPSRLDLAFPLPVAFTRQICAALLAAHRQEILDPLVPRPVGYDREISQTDPGARERKCANRSSAESGPD